MDKKMFLVRVACDAAACICAFACVSDHLERKKICKSEIWTLLPRANQLMIAFHVLAD